MNGRGSNDRGQYNELWQLALHLDCYPTFPTTA